MEWWVAGSLAAMDRRPRLLLARQDGCPKFRGPGWQCLGVRPEDEEGDKSLLQRWKLMRPTLLTARRIASPITVLLCCNLVAPSAASERPITERLNDDVAPMEVLRGWVPVGVPTEDERSCANSSRVSFQVGLSANGTLEVSTHDELQVRRDEVPYDVKHPLEAPGRVARRVAARLGDHWVVGLDLGEYGGGLWTIDAAGRQRALSKENVRDLFQRDGHVIALGGRPVPGSGAAIDVFLDSKGVVRARTLAVFDGYPAVGIRDGNIIFVITNDGLISLRDSGLVREEFRYPFTALYPNSVVRRPGEILVGMRHFLLELRQSKDAWSPLWLAPESCKALRRSAPNERCVCSS